jgi:hypothetical protein
VSQGEVKAAHKAAKTFAKEAKPASLWHVLIK